MPLGVAYSSDPPNCRDGGMGERTEHGQEAQRPRRHRLRHPAVVATLALVAVLVIIVVLQILSDGDGFSTIDEASGNWAYLAVFLLVFGDALCALFPVRRRRMPRPRWHPRAC
jgi:peptidoglycan/LPS O-acetylase OafA/YrhL